MSSPLRSFRRVRRGPGVARGFSLIEMLVVVAILGMIAAIAVQSISKSFQRASAQQAAGDIKTFAQRVQNETRMRGHVVFLRLAQDTTVPVTWRVQLWEDTNDNRTPDTAGATPADTLIVEYIVPRGISLSTASTAQIATSGWSVNTADTAARVLGCDSLGRTFIPGGAAQITANATLDITHVNMVPPATARLKPITRYQLRIGPVWSGAVVRSQYTGLASPNDWKDL